MFDLVPFIVSLANCSFPLHLIPFPAGLVLAALTLLNRFVFQGKPVEVTVEIKVVSFGELNEADMV